MLKRIKVRDLSAGQVFYINCRRFKCYGCVIRDDHVFVAAYEDLLREVRKLSYLSPDMEVLIDE